MYLIIEIMKKIPKKLIQINPNLLEETYFLWNQLRADIKSPRMFEKSEKQPKKGEMKIPCHA